MTSYPSDRRGRRPYDIAVVGAGPAGLAAAVRAADLGLSVALVDAAPRPGGQFYRQLAPGLRAARPERLHHGWTVFTRLAERLDAHRRSGAVRHLASRQVWTVEAAGGAGDSRWTLHTVSAAETGEEGSGDDPLAVPARALLLATGAYERQLPFPGWTLPGVVAAGGSQAMLKSGLVLPGRRVVVAGSGPLLIAVAASLVAAGAEVPAVVEAGGYLGYARWPRALAAVPGKVVEGAGYAASLARHRVRVLTRAAVVEAHGADRVRAVTVAGVDRDWAPVPGKRRSIDCDAVAVGHGLVPQTDLATALGCRTRTTPDLAFAVAVDGRQRSSVAGLWAAGEAAGVGGVHLAVIQGELAAFDIAGRTPPPALRRRRDRQQGFADVMARVHAPGSAWTGWLTDDTEVCRCEEVTAGRVRDAVADLGACDERTAKLLTRAGMGWCQGRMCGSAVAALTSVSAPPGRPLAAPVPLSVLAALPAAEQGPADAGADAGADDRSAPGTGG